MKNLAVNEIFGPTLQGEGSSIGLPVFFLRLAGCNLACQWCDTPYAWDWSRHDVRAESHITPVDKVLEALETLAGKSRPRNLVITGGEPMLQQDALAPLVYALRARGWYTEMETAGTLVPNDQLEVSLYNVSLKLAGSGNPVEKRVRPAAIGKFNLLAANGRAFFKFVIHDENDLSEMSELVKVHGIPTDRIYLMPEGKTPEELSERTRFVFDAAVAGGYRMTTRLQILAYGAKRAI